MAVSSIDSEINPDALDVFYDLSGYGLGAYATWQGGPIYVDGLVNYVTLDTGATTGEEGEATAMGVRGEAGYRLTFMDGAGTLEPLAALSWNSIDAGGWTLADGPDVGWDKISTLAAGLGLRITGKAEWSEMAARFSFTGRAWQPVSQDETVTNIGPSHALAVEDDDILGDVAFTAGLDGMGGRLSLTGSAGMKFMEDYEAGELLLGVRYRF